MAHSYNAVEEKKLDENVGNGSLAAKIETSQTAKDYIETQIQLEADAREALPYQFDNCTRSLGPLKQNLFACLTCNPNPSFTSNSDTNSPEDGCQLAAMCYACSISCHGEHTLVELFGRRNFLCDCGSTKFPDTSPCTLRVNASTGLKGDVKGEAPSATNTYNHNVSNRFCDCGELYDSNAEKGTMYQCLGLATEADNGCGEDWWHPECIIHGGKNGKEMRARKTQVSKPDSEKKDLLSIQPGHVDDETTTVPGFPDEESFETFVCYKCVEKAQWIKQYAGTDGFLPPVYKSELANGTQDTLTSMTNGSEISKFPTDHHSQPNKRKASDAGLNDNEDARSEETEGKRPKPLTNITADQPVPATSSADSSLPSTTAAYHNSLPKLADPSRPLSVFCKEDFRDHFCRCRECYPHLQPHSQLLEEEDLYEPPLSQSDGGDVAAVEGTGSVGSKSLLERGEAALSNMDRVRAIEGVMAYNHLKEKVKSFLQPFAESGKAVGAEDIKTYFEKLRGDDAAIKDSAGLENEVNGNDGDSRREQGGY